MDKLSISDPLYNELDGVIMTTDDASSIGMLFNILNQHVAQVVLTLIPGNVHSLLHHSKQSTLLHVVFEHAEYAGEVKRIAFSADVMEDFPFKDAVRFGMKSDGVYMGFKLVTQDAVHELKVHCQNITTPTPSLPEPNDILWPSCWTLPYETYNLLCNKFHNAGGDLIIEFVGPKLQFLVSNNHGNSNFTIWATEADAVYSKCTRDSVRELQMEQLCVLPPSTFHGGLDMSGKTFINFFDMYMFYPATEPVSFYISSDEHCPLKLVVNLPGVGAITKFIAPLLEVTLDISPVIGAEAH